MSGPGFILKHRTNNVNDSIKSYSFCMCTDVYDFIAVSLTQSYLIIFTLIDFKFSWPLSTVIKVGKCNRTTLMINLKVVVLAYWFWASNQWK